MKRGLLQILTVLSRQAARSSHVLAIGLMTMLASLLMFAAGSSAQAANACDVTGRYIDVDTTFKLLFQCNDGKIEGLHLVALGWNGAGKQVQGDRRTPLGVYPLGEPRDSAYFKFIPIGYPTPEQRRKGYTGYAVGVHGPAKEYDFLGDVTAVINWTDGCIALGTGRETLDVAQWVSDNQVRSIRIR